jgi:catechol 2,3-dioxygenase-like lactoylglutathione lyase family enzyme
MTLQSLTPILFVERIEPCLPFWTERLGFRVDAQVPEGADLGFVMLARDGVALMLQSRESVRKDVPALANEPSRVALYLKVDDLAAIEPRLGGLDVVVPRRRTFYGATEIWVRDPAGNLVCVSQHDEG